MRGFEEAERGRIEDHNPFNKKTSVYLSFAVFIFYLTRFLIFFLKSEKSIAIEYTGGVAWGYPEKEHLLL